MSSSGVFTATSAGTATITATSTQDSTKSGTASVLVNVPAPSNLVYPQTTIAAAVGQPITADTPTVTGTVTSFSVSPALPAGLSLNTTTGTVSGTPTVAAAQANYTVTASNATGSASATLQITILPVVTVLPAIPAYPRTTITAIAGQPITPDTPVVTGTGISYSVSPPLPAGLSFDGSTGTISGTPTAAKAQSVYTVTAVAASGTYSIAVTIGVLRAQSAVLDLGHAAEIGQIQIEGGRVLSMDNHGHWALWDYTSGAELVNGDGAQPTSSTPTLTASSIRMAGPTFVVESSNGLQVRAQSDGHMIFTILFDPRDSSKWWRLASDGSYICVGTENGLFVYSTTGQLSASKAGDYSEVKPFCAPGLVFVALGPAGQNVIEAVSTADGTSTISPQFSGKFHSWFVDGARFLTNESTTVWVYSNTAVQQAIVALPSVQFLTGQGDWIWTYDNGGARGYPLEIYAIGSQTPSFTYPGDSVKVPFVSGATIAMFQAAGPPSISIIDLSGASPQKTDYSLPVASLFAYAASSASQWIVGNQHGTLFDGASPSNAPRYFGLGAAWSIAGSSTNAVIGAAIGKDLVFDTDLSTVQETIGFSSMKVALSSDGSVMGALANGNDNQYEPDRTLNVYSLPSTNVIKSYPGSFPGGGFDFSLAGSGTTISELNSSGVNVTPITGGTSIWSGTSGDALLSPDGTLIANSSGSHLFNTVTNIIQNGALVTAVPGVSLGWIDNNRLLVQTYTTVGMSTQQILTGSTIYGPTGVALATPALPALGSNVIYGNNVSYASNIQTVTSDTFYNPTSNSIYSLTTGQAVWTGTLPGTGVGAVAGPNIVYESGNSVIAEPY